MSDCKFPYTGTDCQTTYADYIGNKYYLYNGIFIGAGTITFIFTSIQVFRIMFYTFGHKYSLNRRIIFLAWLANLFYLIQSVDPQGYRGILPPIIEVLSAEISTILCLGILYVFIIKLVIILQGPLLAPQTDNAKKRELIFWSALAAVAVILSTTFSFLQVYKDRSLYRGLKLLGYAFMILIATIKVDYLLWLIKEDAELINRSIKRLWIFASIYNLLAVVVCLYQIISGSITIDQNTELKPELTVDSVIFPFCEILGILLATAFMSKVDYDKEINFDAFNLD